MERERRIVPKGLFYSRDFKECDERKKGKSGSRRERALKRGGGRDGKFSGRKEKKRGLGGLE